MATTWLTEVGGHDVAQTRLTTLLWRERLTAAPLSQLSHANWRPHHRQKLIHAAATPWRWTACATFNASRHKGEAQPTVGSCATFTSGVRDHLCSICSHGSTNGGFTSRPPLVLSQAQKQKHILTNKRPAVGVTARWTNRRNGDCRPGSYDVMTSSRMLALH